MAGENARPQVGNASRVMDSATWLHAVATGVLTLTRPPPGDALVFNADDFVLIDFRAIIEQWVSLVRQGRTLKLVFSNGSVIELQNFFSFDSVSGDGNSPDSGSATANDHRAQVAGDRFLTAEQFARTYDVEPLGSGGAGSRSSTLGSSSPVPPVATGGLSTPLPSTEQINVVPPPFPDPVPPFFPSIPSGGPPPQPTPGPPAPNGAPVITAAVDQGATSEDAAAAAITGTINFTDANPNDAHVVSVIPGQAGYLGTFAATISNTATGDGAGQVTWSFSADNAALQFLAQGEALSQIYTVTIDDGLGGTTSQTVTITIVGTNDAPVVTAAVDSGEVTEGPLPLMATSGTIDFGDVDLTDAHVTSIIPGGGGYLGVFVTNVTNDSTGDGTGRVTWLFAANNQLRQSVRAAETVVQTYTVTIADGHGRTATQLITITIHGTNDAAVISGDSSGAVVEAGGVNNGTPGTPVDSGNLDAADVDDPNDLWEPVSSSTASANGYGTFTLTAAGVWTYTLDNNNAAVQALPAGSALIDSFTAATIDGTEQVVSITIAGANDAPTAAADSNAGDAVTESGAVAGDPSASGNVLGNDTDPDNSDSKTVTAVSGSATNVGALVNGTYGTLTLAANGAWTYALDDARPDTNALAQDQVVADIFIYTMTDAGGLTSSATLTITITGGNDAPVVTAAVDSGEVTEGPLPVMATSGTIDFGDVDLADAHVTSITPGDGSYLGDFTANVTNASTGDGTGQVTWLFAANNQLRQSVGAGETRVQTYTVTIEDGHGGTATQLVTITIHGTNDAAVITGDTTGFVVEAGGVNNDDALGTPTATGNLNATDVDDPTDAWTAVGSPTASANGYGKFTISSAGAWSYTLDNNNPAVQALPAGGTLTDSFTVATIDGTEQVVTIIITGSNDAPVAVADSNAGDAVIESGMVAGDPSASGNVLINDTDPDAGDSRIVTAVSGAAGNVGQPLVGTYGTLTLGSDGIWTYALNNADPDTNALSGGQIVTETFTYTMTDAGGAISSAALVITITGGNDAPVVTGAVDNGDVTEGPLPVMMATGTIDFGDVDLTDAHVTSITPGAGGYLGILVADVTDAATGDGAGRVTWLFAANNQLRQSVRAGDTLVQTYTVTIDDGHGGTATQLVTITINGTNDAAVITGDASGAVIEAGGVNNGTPGTPVDSGNLDATDVDDPNDLWEAISSPTASANGYGTFTLTTAGVWTYTLNDSNAAVQAVPLGGTLTDTFTVATIDGTEQVVTITINGTNDAPTAVSDNNTGDAVIETGIAAGDPSAAGNVLANDTDPDSGDTKTVTAVNGSAGNVGALTAGIYGTLTLGANGLWTYTLNNADPETNALAQGQVATDTFTYITADAGGLTSSATLTITITGGNDAPVVTAAVDSGEVTEGSLPVMTTSGTIDFGDVDLTDAHITSITPAAGGYLGTFVANVTNASTGDGTGQVTWLFAANNALRRSIGAGDTLIQTYTVEIADGHGGTATQLVTITIHGTNDAAVITGDATGAVMEAGGVNNGTPGIPVDSGNLDATDVDDPNDLWEGVSSPTASANGYGTFMVTTAGVWTYTLDNSNAAVQAVPLDGTLTDSFTVATIDGTEQAVTIIITGANDAPVVTAAVDSGEVTEGPLPVMTTSGTIDYGDVDLTDAHITSITPAAGGYLGTFVANVTNASTGDGAGRVTWLFAANNQLRQSIRAAETLVQTYTVTIDDGHGGTTTQLVTITIHGTNDAAVITGDASGAVIEAGGVNNGTPGTPVDSGDLDATDVDDPNDLWEPVSSPTASTNGYGTFTLTAAGEWTYTLDNNNAAVQALPAGSALTDSFTVATIDGTSQVVTITINGTNDAAVVTGSAAGAVVEAGGTANGVAGTPVATGDLNSADVDNASDSWNAVTVPTLSVNGYGTFMLSAAGVWTYTLDNNNAAVQAVNVGATLTDSFTATTIDGTSQLVTITIHGANDAAVITGAATGSVIEAGGVANGIPGTPAATGDLNATDVDNAPDAWTAVATPVASTNGYGTFTLTATGGWNYTLDNSNAAVQALNVGGTLTDSFTVATIDGTEQVVTITIDGSNDAAVISGVANGSVTEAGGVANGTPGAPTATGNLNATDVDNASDTWSPVLLPTPSANGYGTYHVLGNGVWLYTIDNTNPAVEALRPGDTLTDGFTATTVDGTSQIVSITITGTHDAAVITGDTTGAVVEAGGVANSTPGTPTASGDLNATDPDNDPDSWAAVTTPTASTNGYGTFTVSAAGLWTYTLDNSNAAVQSLNTGHTLADTFTATTVDGTAQVVTITITGTNDDAVIVGDTTGVVVEAGGVGSGIPGVPVATGNLGATDVDNPPDSWNAVSTPTASTNGYGSFVLTGAGAWIYLLNNGNAAVQALNPGDTLTDSFTANTVDGTAQVVTITIAGTDDDAVVSGDIAGTVLEAGGIANGTPGIPAATGDLDAADVDNPPGWTPVGTPTPGDSGYGSYTLTAAGVWAYTLDNSHAAVQALNAGATLTDTFTAITAGGTAQVVTITIVGANDNAVITGDTTGSVVEAGGVANAAPGTPTTTGDLNSTDVDNPDDVWTPTGLLRGAGGLGTYTLTATGSWTYTLDNSNAAVQALNAGQSLTDSFTATTVDGTAQLVTITINGANDAAVISGVANGAVTEAGGVANGTPGVPTNTGDLNSTDVDNPADSWNAVVAPTSSANGYGAYTLTAAGVWAYTLDNGNATVQALNVGGSLTDSFTVTTVDGTAQAVTITINGANDDAVITGDGTGATVEAGGVANGTPGTPTDTGDLNSTDVDNPADSWTVVGAPTLSISGYGSYTVTAAGVWVYTLNNSNATVQALNVGGSLTDSFTATTVDGTAQLVTITINGANDDAVITGNAAGTTVEAGGVANGTPGTPSATGDLNAGDVDNANDSWAAVAIPASSANGYGSFTLSAAGVWIYTLDNSNATVQALNVGGSLSDTFTVTTVDGTAQVVTITIDGANDAAVITGQASGATVEAGGVANGSPGTPSATGDLNAADVDNPADSWNTIGVPTLTSNSYGSFTISPAGVWVYTLDNSNATVQALNVGGSLTDSFTVTTVDGTAQVVTVTIDGANDAAVITGDTVGAVVEAGGVANGTPGIPTYTGDLDADDVDNPDDSWNAVVAPTSSANGYGAYTLTAAGVWAYTLDNGNAAVQALNVGDTLVDAFLATTSDGTARLVAVAIRGTNDAAVITGSVTGSVVEAGGIANGTPGTPTATGDLNSTDVDNLTDAWEPVSFPAASANGYGIYTLTAAGIWTYQLSNSNAAVQALNAGGTLTDSFTVTTVDGTAQLVTITIQGSNDAAVITGLVTDTVVEAGGVAHGTPGTPTATGDLDAADVDNPTDAWIAVVTPAAGSNGFGTYTLTTAGVWSYTLDNSNATVQALNVGETLTDTFTVTTVDGTTQAVTITIQGTNDAAVVSGAISGSVTEAGGVANGTPGTPTVIGDLNSTDVDDANDAWIEVTTPTAGIFGYGTYTMTAGGVWTYTLLDGNAAVQALNVGETLTGSFTAATVDGTSQVVTITIQGANDAAVISGLATGTVVEASGVANATPGTPTATGNLNSTDVDNPSDVWNPVLLATPSANGYGTYHVLSNGVWLYTIDNGNATVQALNAGGSLNDTFTVTTIDGTSQLVTITIQGANDAAVITGAVTGTVVEAGGVSNGTPGTPTATGNLNAADVDNTADAWIAVGTPAASSNGFGTYTLTAAGVWTYTVDNSNATVQALNAGDTLTDSFTVTTVDGTSQVVTITIEGSNDAAVTSGDSVGTVVEAGGVGSGIPGVPVVTGDLNSADVDNPDNAWIPVAASTPSTNGYGTYTLTAAGVWTYTLDNTNPTVNALGAGGTLTDTFTATTVDGTAQVVTIAIVGTDDAAVISGDITGNVLEAGGVANGTPGIPAATGDLDAADDDTPPGWVPVGTPTPGDNGHGTYTLTAAGVWTYTLDNSNAAVQALNAGQTLTDTFTATTVGATSQVVTITITGANDAATITGSTTGDVIEAGGVANGSPGNPTATGDLNSTDVDNTSDSWATVTTVLRANNHFGSYTLTAAGVWTYTVDNGNAAVQALNVGQTLTDTFTAFTVDGTAQVVTVTINGANDAATITGSTTGDVTEAGGVANGTAGSSFAGGDLNATDVDNGSDSWVAVTTPAASAGGLGTYVLSSSGAWVYTLDDNNAAVQALNAGQTLTDTFTATTVDGTSQAVTITIQGANDDAVITGPATGTVVEAGGVANGTPGTPTATGNLNATDVDNPNDTWTAVGTPTPSANGYGTFTLTAAGLWTYTLDNTIAAVQALNTGGTLTDTFTVTTIDGTAQVVTITIQGANDAAVITGTTTGTVAEAGGVANGTPGTPNATGDLNATDFDNVADSWAAITTPAASAGGFGTYVLSSSGGWVYTLNNTNSAVQALNAGGTLTDTFTATTIGGTSQVVTVTINGANDAAVITGPATGNVVEAGGVANGTPGTPSATGNLNATDVDNPVDSWNAVATPTLSVSGYGTYTLTAAGVWTYTLDNNNANVQALNVGGSLTDTFTVTTVDGTAQVVTITIAGANDDAVITGTTTGTVAEAGGVDNATPGTPTATGDLNSTDVDNTSDSWVAVATSTLSNSGRGSFTMTAAGAWTYTLDNSHVDVEALNVGGTLTDTFTATTIGGTSQVVTVTINGANDAPHAVPDDNNGDVVKRAVGGAPGDLLAVGNVLDNDVDVDAGDTKTVIAVNGSAANVGQTLVGVYGTLVLTAGGAWTYSLNESDPDTQALALGQTAVDAFSYTMSDSQGATSSTTLDVTVTGGNDPPYIITSSPHRFVTPSEPGDLVFINGFSFQDIDSFGIVTVTIASSNFSDALHATSGGGVAVSGNGSRSITLTGTIADINAFISGNNVAWDPPAGDFDRNFTFTIDDNGSLAGGMVVSTSVFFDERTLSFSDFNSDNVNLAGWNLNNNVFVSTRGGNDTVVTAWSHGPNSNSSDYDGGDGFDTITLVFTPDQLESILSNSTDRGTLQDYLDGDVSAPFDDDSLSLGGTSWNATVTDFEDASLALAAGPSGFVRYDAIGENIPDFEFAPSIGNETLVGTSGNDTISALGDNDIVVGRGGNDTLNGDAGSDMLLGGSGNDTLRGGTGSDILSGGTGADRFVFAETGAINSDSIVDYSFVDGDTLDLSALLDAAYSAGQPISDFVRAVQSGSDIIIQVDIDGGFNSFTDVVTLTRYGTNSADIVRLTFEGTDHLLLV